MRTTNYAGIFALLLIAVMPGWHAAALARDVTNSETLTQSGAASPATDAGSLSFSGGITFEYNTHLVSYGRDVWGGGNDWSRATFNPSAWFNANTKYVSIFAGTWLDINSHGSNPEIDSKIQEIDATIGVSFRAKRFLISFSHSQWFYNDQAEKIFDLSFGYDDYGLLSGKFGIRPGLLIHYRADSDGLENTGVLVVGIDPWYTFWRASQRPITLSIPVNAGFFGNLYHGGDSGYGYVSVGPRLFVPLTKWDGRGGYWSINMQLLYYSTDKNVIPTNPDENFLTGNLGISASF